MSESIPGLWPGEVESYDPAARTCRVRIPGITDGSSVLPVAVFSTPLGDRADHADAKSHTEIRILPNDPVWLMFECGDPRFPIIMGFRTKRDGNPVNWRRWRHANIEMTAENELIINATKVIWNVSGDVIEHIGGSQTTDIGGNQTTDVTGAMESTAATSEHQSNTHMLIAQTTLAGAVNSIAHPTTGAKGFAMQGPISMENQTFDITNMTVTFTGCTIKSNGKKIDHTHTHLSNGDGADTDPPNA